mgnify:FL=1|jgi:hypothetical protein
MDQVISNGISNAIKEIVEQIAPDVRFVPKYGGEVLVHDPDSDKKFVGGIYVCKDHVSLEFSQGASFDDPDGRLEGKGKNRRHLKFATVEDVMGKDAEGFLKQTFGIA